MVLYEICDSIKTATGAALTNLINANDILVKSPQHAGKDKLGIYIYHFNRNPHYVNSPSERVSAGRYRAPLLVIEANIIIYSTFDDSEQEMNFLENVSDYFFRHPFIVQKSEAHENVVKIISKIMGLEELNKFWSMFPAKAQSLALFYQLAPVFVYPKADQLETLPEIQPVSSLSDAPKIDLETRIINE